jgi:hypothetical protein
MTKRKFSTIEVSPSEINEGYFTVDLMSNDSQFVSLELSPEDIKELATKLNLVL